MPRKSLLKNHRPIHPGKHLRENVLPAFGRSNAEIARLLGIPSYTLYAVLNEKRKITAGLALRIGKLLGEEPADWLIMQLLYELEIAERALAKTLKTIPTLQAAE